MADDERFGFDPEDLDRLFRGAGEQLRGVLGKMFEGSGDRAGFSTLFEEFGPRPRSAPEPEPETTGAAGSGVWAIYTVDDEGGARVEQVYPTELDALRANKNNTDVRRMVRFLPYGMAVSVLDSLEESPEKGDHPA